MSSGIAASGQQAPADSSIPLIRAHSDLVLVDSLVIDGKSNPPAVALDASDFVLTENGRQQKILDCSRDELPLSIVMLFDLTGSVQSQLAALSSEAKNVLEHLRPEDEVAVMTFSSTTQRLQPFTHDHRAIADAIQQAAHSRSKEATFIDDVVYQASEEVARATIPNSRRVLLFFTDGTSDPPSPLMRKMSPSAATKLHSHAEALHYLLRCGITVSALIERSAATNALLLAQNVNPADALLSLALGDYAHGNDFRHYADATGGPYLKGKGRDAPQKMIELIDELRNRYTLAYRPSSSCAAGDFCRITLRFSRKALTDHPEFRTKHYKIKIPSGYFR